MVLIFFTETKRTRVLLKNESKIERNHEHEDVFDFFDLADEPIPVVQAAAGKKGAFVLQTFVFV